MKKKFLSYLIFFSAVFISLVNNSCKRENSLLKADQKKLEALLATSKSTGEAQIPDFSFAGYEKNEKAIPEVPVMETVQPGEGDDGDRIQAAINKVSAAPLVNGFRGAILLKAGNYEVEKTINISASGVILRGEGQTETGTVVLATKNSKNNQFPLVNVNGTGNYFLAAGEETAINQDIVPVGTRRISLTSSSAYKPGDTILVVKVPNQTWINTIDMAQYGWTTADYKMFNLRVIERIESDAIWIDIPMVDEINKVYGGGYIIKVTAPGRISHCGVENIKFKSSYAYDTDEDHAWTAVKLSRATNCWVKNVTAQYFGSNCVAIYNQSDFNTIQDCVMLDPKSLAVGSRRYSFYIDYGMGNLFQRCFTRGGRHDFVTGARVLGPNVFLDCLATESTDEAGPHHRWSTGLLFDNVSGGILRAVNRGSIGTGQGWTGAQVMFWNSTASVDFRVSSPPTATNWAIGCKGRVLSGNAEFISKGIPVNPRSLFLSQLEKRLGSTAVYNITNEAQRNGSIEGTLSSSAGN